MTDRAPVADDEMRLSLGQVETFGVKADGPRTFTALALPWNRTTIDYRRLSFAPGSVELPSAPGRVKLLDQHDSWSTSALIGKAVAFSEDEDGLRITFEMATTPEADRAWHLMTVDKILDGVSVGLAPGTKEFRVEYQEDTDVGVVLSGVALKEMSVVTIPAFDDARVELGAGILAAFSAARKPATGPRGETNTAGDNVTDENTPEINVTLSTEGLAEQLSAAMAAQTTALTEAFAAEVGKAFENIAGPGEGLDAPSATGSAVVTERPVYGLGAPGSTYSLIQDFSVAKYDEGDPGKVAEARERLKKFQHMASNDPSFDIFATVRADLPALNVATNRPDLYQEQLDMSRPLYDAVTKGVLSNITPFVFPKFVSSAGLTADHVEGVNPTPGTVTVGNQTITPKAISGSFKGSRELFDAATPQLDDIVLRAMRIDYEQKIEALIAARLDAVSLSGVHAQVLDLSDSTGDDGAALIDLLTNIFIDQAFTFTGFRINRAVSSKEPYTLLANAKDSQGRRLIPAIGAQNADGTRIGAGLQGLNMNGQYILPGAVTARKLYAFAAESVWVGLSTPKMFRFEEKDGPANIELAIFGYEASAVTRDSDVYKITVQD